MMVQNLIAAVTHLTTQHRERVVQAYVHWQQPYVHRETEGFE
jgi:hypothetical protein